MDLGLGLGLAALSGVVFVMATNASSSSASDEIWTPTVSTVDGRGYRVMHTENAIEAANQLARVCASLQMILDYLHAHPPPPKVEVGVHRLLSIHPDTSSIRLVELDPEHAKVTIAYNEDKSRNIFVCMRRYPNKPDLGPDDTILYIVLHELAHTMIDGFAPKDAQGNTIHDANFRDHNEFLNRVAERLGILAPGHIPGREHCGVSMPDPNTSI